MERIGNFTIEKLEDGRTRITNEGRYSCLPQAFLYEGKEEFLHMGDSRIFEGSVPAESFLRAPTS